MASPPDRAVGKLADLVVLDADPLAVPVDAIHTVTVRQTWVGGARVDESSEQPA